MAALVVQAVLPAPVLRTAAAKPILPGLLIECNKSVILVEFILTSSQVLISVLK